MTEKKNKAYIFADVDVSNHVESKGWAKYLNWAFVNDVLHKHDDNASYSVKQYPVFDLKTRQVIPHMFQHYFLDPNTNNASVTVTVTFRGKSQTETLPCYQQIRHKGMVSVKNPDSMLVNKTAKRAEVKAAAELTGLGISLYMNGSTKGADKVSNSNQGRYKSNNYVRSNYSNRASSSANRSVNNKSSQSKQSFSQAMKNKPASKKQINWIHGLMNDIDTGLINDQQTKVYKWAYGNDFKNTNMFVASRAISVLKNAPKKTTLMK